MLQGSNVDLLSPHLSVEETVNNFNLLCRESLDNAVPLRLVCRKNKSAPWYNDQVKSLRKQCRRCKCKKNKLQISYEMLRDWVNYQRAMKTARSQHFSDIIEKNYHNPRVLFSTINYCLNPKIEVSGDLWSLVKAS